MSVATSVPYSVTVQARSNQTPSSTRTQPFGGMAKPFWANGIPISTFEIQEEEAISKVGEALESAETKPSKAAELQAFKFLFAILPYMDMADIYVNEVGEFDFSWQISRENTCLVSVLTNGKIAFAALLDGNETYGSTHVNNLQHFQLNHQDILFDVLKRLS
jgi:hypothetical protein